MVPVVSLLVLWPGHAQHVENSDLEIVGDDDVRLGADADRGAKRLARQHVRAVELAVDHTVGQHSEAWASKA